MLRRRPRSLLALLAPIVLVAPVAAAGRPNAASLAATPPRMPPSATAASSTLEAAPPFSATPRALRDAAHAFAAATPGDPDAVILLEDLSETFDARGASTTHAHTILQVLTRAGVEQWQTLSVSFSPWHQDPPTFRVRVITPDEKEHWLDPRAIETRSAEGDEDDTMLNDRRRLRAPLSALVPGAIVEEDVVITDRAPLFDAGIYESYDLRSHDPIARLRLTLDAPASLPLRADASLAAPLAESRSRQDNRQRVVWSGGPVAPSHDEPSWLPADVPRSRRVHFSTGASWQAIARRYRAVLEEKVKDVELGPLGAPVAPGPVAARAAELMARLRNIRYTGVELGEAAIVPVSPAEVIQRGYGDCKDQSLLLVTLLRRAGVPAHVALLSAGYGPDMRPGLPGFGGFNHAIVFVPPSLWIDPTEPLATVGTLPQPDQGRWALVVADETTTLVRTPSSSSHENRFVEALTFRLPVEGHADLIEQDQGTGLNELWLRQGLVGKKKADIDKQAERYAKEHMQAKKLAALSYGDPLETRKPLVVRYDMRGTPLATATRSGAEANLSFAFFESDLPSFLDPEKSKEEDKEGSNDKEGESPEPRRTDYDVAHPIALERRYEVIPPDGMRAVQVPKTMTRKLGPATLTSAFVTEAGGTVRGTLTFDYGKQRYTVAEVADFKAALKAFREEADPGLVKYESLAEAAKRDGKIPEALALWHKLAAAHPQEAAYPLAEAELLLSLGFGERARDLARTALELAPSSAAVAESAGLIFAHDTRGRLYHRGFDAVAAEAAWREALRLEPDRAAVHFNLAVLSEYGTDGERYGQAMRAAEAERHYRAILDAKPPATGIDLDQTRLNLTYLICFQKRFAEAATLAKKTPQSTWRNVLLVAALAASQGLAAARIELDHLGKPADQQQVATSAGVQLLALKTFEPATALLDESMRRSGSASLTALRDASKQMGGVLKHAEEATAEAAALRMVLALGDENLGIEEVAPTIYWDGPLRDGLLAAIRSSRHGTAKRFKNLLNLSGRLHMAIGLAAATPHTEDDGDGTKRVRFSYVGKTERDDFFLTAAKGPHDSHDRRDSKTGGWRIVATGTTPEGLAVLALQKLEKGRLEAAAKLLDWAYDELLQRPVSFTDALSNPVLLRAWSRGQREPARIRCAAASAAAFSTTFSALAGTLRACANDGTLPEEARLAALIALASARGTTPPAVAEALRDSERLLSEHPESPYAARLRSDRLRDAGRQDEAIALLRQKAAEYPAQDLRQYALSLALAGTKAPEGTKHLEERVKGGHAYADEYNTLAWGRLFADNAPRTLLEQAQGEAQKAVDLSASSLWGMLHTLATVHAFAGHLDEARNVALELEDWDGALAKDFNPIIWGRLAEHYGLWDEALATYSHVLHREEETRPDSVWSLAQRRLAIVRKGLAKAAAR